MFLARQSAFFLNFTLIQRKDGLSTCGMLPDLGVLAVAHGTVLPFGMYTHSNVRYDA